MAGSRFYKHVFTTRAAAKRAFPADVLQAIQSAIAEGEAVHRAEIRFAVEAALTWHNVLDNLTSRRRAHELFTRYRIWDTEENCGVLIYVNLADRKVEIITDRAVGRALHKDDWQAVCRTMTAGFAQGHYRDSTLAALRQLNGLLQQHFPANGDNRNELSNKPLVL
ncbi:MAG: TPM domain-containing protein [Proteobacteria bacterium]|nr:TPM domain-containing protein [Pseudomonadota bacterium]